MTSQEKLLQIIEQENKTREQLDTLRLQRVELVRRMHIDEKLSLRKIGKIAGVSHVRVTQWIDGNIK